MKFICLIFLSIFTITSCFLVGCKNEEVFYKYPDGRIWVRKYYKHYKQLKYTGIFRDTLPVGILRGYTMTGMMDFETNYDDNGIENGIIRTYYDNFPNGNYLRQEGQNYKSKPIGYWKFYRPNGTLGLIINLDSFSNVVYYARFDDLGRFKKDSIGIFTCDTSMLY